MNGKKLFVVVDSKGVHYRACSSKEDAEKFMRDFSIEGTIEEV
jgi:hypothetical protein